MAGLQTKAVAAKTAPKPSKQETGHDAAISEILGQIQDRSRRRKAAVDEEAYLDEAALSKFEKALTDHPLKRK